LNAKNTADFKVGDLVMLRPRWDGYPSEGENEKTVRKKFVGIVIEVGYNMWGEEGDQPTGIRVLWQDTMEIEILWGDELIKVEGHKN